MPTLTSIFLWYNVSMDENILLEITSSIEQKLGAENAATIADDLGKLITSNSNTVERIKTLENDLSSQRSVNEKLVIANGNLLKQIPVEGPVASAKKVDNAPDTKASSFRFEDAFDKNGRFIK